MNRQEILQRFEQLVDSALASEEPPAGIDPLILAAISGGTEGGTEGTEGNYDSYSLWAAITALTQEVKLQGRAFQELNHTLNAQTNTMLDEVRATYGARESNLRRDTELRCRKEALGALIDLRDRLGRGRESARLSEQETQKAAKVSWIQRAFSPPDVHAQETVSALVRGYELGLERLDQTLDEFNAREIRCDGELFDPRRMNAIDSQISASVPDGSVLEVYRSGYEWNGEVFRTAQVKVSRSPQGDEK